MEEIILEYLKSCHTVIVWFGFFLFVQLTQQIRKIGDN